MNLQCGQESPSHTAWLAALGVRCCTGLLMLVVLWRELPPDS